MVIFHHGDAAEDKGEEVRNNEGDTRKDIIKGVKLYIPHFQGKSDLEA